MKRIVAVLALVLVAVTAFLILNLTGSSLASDAATPDFKGLPINVARTVEFDQPELEAGSAYDGSTTPAAAAREITDQLRDWLLWTVVSSGSLSMQEVKNATFDTPPYRRSQIRAVSSLEYGVTRSTPLPTGNVIALIPKGTPEQEGDDLADVVDEQRKNTGVLPPTVYVFAYELAPDFTSASLTRRPDVPGEQLFSPASGYIERSVATLDDLRDFLAQTNDLVLARREKNGLTLGGRHFRGRSYRGIGVEDVATLWQSELKESSGSQGSGFSLDPVINWATLSASAENQLRPKMVQRGLYADAARLTRAISARDLDGLLVSLTGLCGVVSEAQCKQKKADFLMQHQFQRARYDGTLQGTEVGMVLFYTDLIMKLWSLDFEETAPRSVAGFPNEMAMSVAAIYQTEVEDLPGTRLWLGSRMEGFQVLPHDDGLAFARTATRVFARPLDLLANTDRTDAAEPHVYDRTLMTWWNDHYDEVAVYEPQYQRLNEIMKWSQAMAWLNAHGHGDLLSVLREVPIDRSNWFPEWARRHSELTYKAWDDIGFKPRGFQGTTTEALRLVPSIEIMAFGRPLAWIGGVSLARRAQLLERPSLPSEAPVALRRGRLDFKKSDLNTGKLRTLDGIDYEFEATAQNMSRMTARLDASKRLRGLVGEYESGQQSRILTRTLDELRVEVKGDAAAIGDLRITQRAGNNFRVVWQAREMDLGQRVARRFSLESELGLTRDADVRTVMKLSENDYLVKLHDGDRWIRLSKAPADSKSVRPGYQARVSALGDRAQNVDVAWVTPDDVPKLIQPDSWVYAPNRPQAGRDVISVGPRPPPTATARPIVLQGKSIKTFETDNGLAMRWGDLPDEVQHSAELLQSRNLNASTGPGASGVDTDALSSSNFRRAAQDLVDDPERFRRAADQYLRSETEYIDNLLGSQQYVRARARLERLIAELGDQPSLRLRRALADLAEQRFDRVAQTLEQTSTNPVYTDRFFREINDRLANTATSAETQQNLSKMAAYLEWQQRQLKMPATHPGTVTAAADPRSLTYQWRVDRVPTQRVSHVRGDVRVLYVEDAPGLNSIEWASSVDESLQALVDAERIDIQRISVLDLGQLMPARIVETQSRTTFTLAKSMSSPVSRAGARQAYPRQSCKQAGPADVADQPDCPSIYLVTRNRVAAGTR